jgi:hypothetical protein
VQISTSFEDLCDQNVIVYLLRTKSKEYMPQVLRPAACAPRCTCSVRRKSFRASLTSMYSADAVCGECRYCLRTADTA